MRNLHTNQPHLEYRPTGSHRRRRFPRRWLATETRTPARKTALLFPLRLHLPFEAKVLAQRLTFLTDIAFARSTEMTMAFGPDMMTTYLEELGCFLVDAYELAREVVPQLTAEAAACESAFSQAAIDALRHALSLGTGNPHVSLSGMWLPVSASRSRKPTRTGRA